ncbi:MAG: fumarylacetoacetate hydrolase family protein [Actinomycetota bacterium]|nr:fumarylacetoacetate hydrolase family protein [Actinomycetota bacterium]
MVWPSGHLDVESASGGRFGSDTQALMGEWADLLAWMEGSEPASAGAIEPSELGPPLPRPRQVFAIGLNYAEHAEEAGHLREGVPQVFTKFPSCLAGPNARVSVASPRLDWEVELVVAVGAEASAVEAENAWSVVAGLMVGQDLSARDVQLAGAAPQWSLGKSFAGFGPTGPALVPLANLDRPDDLAIECLLNGERVQHARTSQMVWPVPELVARLSAVCTLYPGDLIFTGTPAGVGNRRQPPRYLAEGDLLVSRIEGLGELSNTFCAVAG